MNRKFIEFTPFYENKIWGGKKFKTILGRNIPTALPVGETREISDNNFVTSVVCNGQFKGKTLVELMNNHSQYIMGSTWKKGKRFPIIVKWLDSIQSSSLQVHPCKNYAQKHKIYEKNEVWFFYQTEANSKIILGLKDGATPEKLFKYKDESELIAQLKEVAIEKGDFVYIPSGCVHAIGGGCLILEIQQNSNTTFRIYDWNREGVRELHKEESLENINTKSAPLHLKPTSDKMRYMLESESFSIVEHKLKAGEFLEFKSLEQPRLLSLLEGEIQEEASKTKPKLFSTILLPHAENFRFLAKKDSYILVTENFI